MQLFAYTWRVPCECLLQRLELTSLRAIATADTTGLLHAPMMAVVDFCGFRVTVMSKMSFSEQTLAYGLSSAGYCADEVSVAAHVAVLHLERLCALGRVGVWWTNTLLGSWWWTTGGAWVAFGEVTPLCRMWANGVCRTLCLPRLRSPVT